VSSITRRSIASLTTVAATLFGLLLIVPVIYSAFIGIMTIRQDSNGGNDPVQYALDLINPFVTLGCVLHPDNSETSKLLSSGWPSCICYVALTAVLVAGTHRRLKRLENPIASTQR
jgi:hypothetical protein